MSEETPEVEAEKAEEVAVDYDAMTERQLAAKQTIIETEVAELRLKADANDATVADTHRYQELRSDLRTIKAARAALAEMLRDDEPEEAPVVEAVEAVEAPAEIAEPVAEEVVEEVADEPVLVAADIDTDKLAGTGPVETATPAEEAKPKGPAIFASLDGERIASTSNASGIVATDMNTVSERFASLMRGLKSQSTKMGTGERFHVMGKDTSGSSDQSMRFIEGTTPEIVAHNTALAHGKIPGQAAVMAECRNPVELETDEVCSYRTDTPIWDLFRTNVDANACSFRWKRNYVLEDIAGGVDYWDACKQALCDPADPTTWKPLAELPDCVDDCYSTAEAFYLTWGLAVTIDDQFCRPDRISEANDLLAAYRAMQLDNIARAYLDKHAGDGGNVWAVDLASFGTDLGLVPAFQIAIAQFVNQFNYSGRFTCDESARVALVPEYIRKHIAIDLSLAGENANSADAVIRDAFAACGINDVQFDTDYGCEGDLSGLLQEVNDGETIPCTDWNCETNPFDAVDGACPAFNSGAPLRPLTERGRIRITHRDAFIKGSTNVVDYQFRQDNSDLRKNQGEYFGESRHFLFPRGDLDSGVLDFINACPSGNRTDNTAAIDCAAVVAPPA